MTAEPTDVANFLIAVLKDSDGSVKKSELRAYVYLTQAESLVRRGLPVFEEDFHIEQMGPVAPSLESHLNKLEDDISEIIGNYDIHVFSPEVIEILMDVAQYCISYPVHLLNTTISAENGPYGTAMTKG